ncbi:MAG TPA: alpha-amylase family glycosyl hydrolase [Bellilinea sp.]|nr:alpha-amylase family glycosyl hydrolase [Bellilinea sp.]
MKRTLRILLILVFVLLAGCQPAPTTDWYKDAVFYEIFVRSFYDSNGDGIGDFNGIREKLDYLNDGDPKTTTDLGITGIWLMPIMPSPSYHGYDVTDYKAVNPQYGTLDDFKRLVEECHKRGIKVIIDLVINHTSSQHPWFTAALNGDPAYKDYYVWEQTKPSSGGPLGSNPWHEAANGEYYYGVFWGGMPDLNYKNPAVTREINNITAFWLKETGIDGFRVDAARYLFEDGLVLEDSDNTIRWFQDWRATVKKLAPKSFTVGEVWADLPVQARYADPKGLDSLFMFDLAEDFKSAAYAGQSSGVHAGYQQALQVFPDGAFSTFLSNHDQQRVASMLEEKSYKLKEAAFLYLTGPGIPFIYYGEELGLTANKPDENLRTPMPWSSEANGGFSTGTPWEPLRPAWEQVNAATLSADEASLLNWYRRLIRLRNDNPALRTGAYLPVKSNCPTVYATLRVLGKDALLTLANLNKFNADGCTLSIDASPLRGEYKVEALWGTAQFPAVTFDDTGAFKDLLAAPSLASAETLVVKLIK